MICEMCGKDVPRLQTVLIEGTRLRVCSECAKFGTPVSFRSPANIGGRPDIMSRLERRERRMREKDVFEEENRVLVVDYSARIRRAREKKGWTREELGTRIGEKRSVIAKLESGEIRPDRELLRKLEKTLEITLTEEVKEAHVSGRRQNRPLTLGDLIRIEMEKQGKG